MKDKPEKKYRAGAVTATVWRNETEKNGETVHYPTVTFERSYTDENGEWQTTNSLRRNDLPKALLVLQKAFEHVSLAAETQQI